MYYNQKNYNWCYYTFIQNTPPKANGTFIHLPSFILLRYKTTHESRDSFASDLPLSDPAKIPSTYINGFQPKMLHFFRKNLKKIWFFLLHCILQPLIHPLPQSKKGSHSFMFIQVCLYKSKRAAKTHPFLQLLRPYDRIITSYSSLCSPQSINDTP